MTRAGLQEIIDAAAKESLKSVLIGNPMESFSRFMDRMDAAGRRRSGDKLEAEGRNRYTGRTETEAENGNP